MVRPIDPTGGRFGEHRFARPELLELALTHRSASPKHNERLEFLGDALINLIVAEELYGNWPRADEGALTRARAQLVRESALAEVARSLQLGDRLQLGPGELKSGGFRRDSILADALEAVIGAIYLDAGLETCRRVVLPWFEPVLQQLVVAGQVEKDPKTRLQEWLQARQLPLPEYAVTEILGEDHERSFRVSCVIRERDVIGEGEAGSRRQAEQRAAERALAQLEAQP